MFPMDFHNIEIPTTRLEKHRNWHSRNCMVSGDFVSKDPITKIDVDRYRIFAAAESFFVYPQKCINKE